MVAGKKMTENGAFINEFTLLLPKTSSTGWGFTPMICGAFSEYFAIMIVLARQVRPGGEPIR